MTILFKNNYLLDKAEKKKNMSEKVCQKKRCHVMETPVKIHLVGLFSQRNVVKYHWGIQYVMEVRYQHHNHLVAEQATTNVL